MARYVALQYLTLLTKELTLADSLQAQIKVQGCLLHALYFHRPDLH